MQGDDQSADAALLRENVWWSQETGDCWRGCSESSPPGQAVTDYGQYAGKQWGAFIRWYFEYVQRGDRCDTAY